MTTAQDIATAYARIAAEIGQDRADEEWQIARHTAAELGVPLMDVIAVMLDIWPCDEAA